MLKKYYIESPFACGPHIFRAPISGQLYALPSWTPLPEGTTREQLVHVKPKWLIEFEANKEVLVQEFKSSKGDITYKVNQRGNKYNCTCPGYKFRNRNCKHIKQVRENIQD